MKVIQVENLGKCYRIGRKTNPHQRSYLLNRLTLSSFNYLIDMLRKPAEEELFWALRDINFEVEEGEVIGIIGRNGAGKSTLLKILSRITEPTDGKVMVHGSVGSLLEVGTGFHPDLTGRENVYLNGSLLGMKKQEIDRQFDAIVDFSGIEQFIDTPVKRYSSGMHVRLGFAVAAHLQPDILIVDEVLAVGDSEFQEKCLGKMKDVAGQGRTVLFVSHNLQAVQNLCTRGILLKKGSIDFVGPLDEVIGHYLNVSNIHPSVFQIPLPDQSEEAPGYIVKLQTEDLNGNILPEIQVGLQWQIRVFFKINRPTPKVILGIGLVSNLGMPITTSWSLPTDLDAGNYEAILQNKEMNFVPGNYNINVGLSSRKTNIHYVEHGGTLTISEVSIMENIEHVVNFKSGLIVNKEAIKILAIS